MEATSEPRSLFGAHTDPHPSPQRSHYSQSLSVSPVPLATARPKLRPVSPRRHLSPVAPFPSELLAKHRVRTPNNLLTPNTYRQQTYPNNNAPFVPVPLVPAACPAPVRSRAGSPPPPPRTGPEAVHRGVEMWREVESTQHSKVVHSSWREVESIQHSQVAHSGSETRPQSRSPSPDRKPTAVPPQVPNVAPARSNTGVKLSQTLGPGSPLLPVKRAPPPQACPQPAVVATPPAPLAREPSPCATADRVIVVERSRPPPPQPQEVRLEEVVFVPVPDATEPQRSHRRSANSSPPAELFVTPTGISPHAASLRWTAHSTGARSRPLSGSVRKYVWGYERGSGWEEGSDLPVPHDTQARREVVTPRHLPQAGKDLPQRGEEVSSGVGTEEGRASSWRTPSRSRSRRRRRRRHRSSSSRRSRSRASPD
eukprot:Hpha_TRINITY_DN5167_c0_g1::TRINITY_DN5167_c0_g1_i1::g.192921::m.192921